MATKNKNLPAKQRRIRYLPELLLVLGIALVCLSWTHRLLRSRSLSIQDDLVTQYTATEEPETAAPLPTHIFIKWRVDVGVEPQLYQDNNWGISDNQASYLINSARPNTLGNIIIYGHNTRSIMGNIRVLKLGEQITLTLSDGSTRNYAVTQIAEVNPNQTELLMPTQEEVLTLYTCSGFLDSKRFVVQAKPVVDQVDEF